MSTLEQNEANVKQDEDMKMNTECRACLQRFEDGSGVVNLFEAWTPAWDGKNGTIADDLHRLSNVQVSDSDEHSKVICRTCHQKLLDACTFVSLVQRNDQILKQRYARPQMQLDVSSETIWPKPIQVDKNINNSVIGNVADIEIKQEVLSEDEYADNANGTGLDGDNVDPILDLIKIEPEELLDTKPHHNLPVEIEAEKCAVVNGYQEHKNNINVDIKQEPLSEDADSDSTSIDMPLECMLCSKDFKSIKGLKAHVIAQHSYKSVRRKTNMESPVKKEIKEKHICATCRRSFETSTDLMVHETCHNKSVCYGCNQKFDTFELLAKHRKRCKAIRNREMTKPKTLDDVKRHPNEDTGSKNGPPSLASVDSLVCSICNEKFSDEYYKRIHEEVHHSVYETPEKGTLDKEKVESVSMETEA